MDKTSPLRFTSVLMSNLLVSSGQPAHSFDAARPSTQAKASEVTPDRRKLRSEAVLAKYGVPINRCSPLIESEAETRLAVLCRWPGMVTAPAGLNDGADNPLTPELLEWADLVFVMERAHRSKLLARFKAHLRNRRIICLEIPDDYAFMDEELVRLLKARVPRHLPSL